MDLFENEKIITQSGDKKITLTSHRIIQQGKESGKSYHLSIMLNHITSCENSVNYIDLLLYLAVIAFVSAGYFGATEQGDLFKIAAGAGLVFAILFILTRTNVITISSASAKMKINASKMNREKALEFIDKVERAITQM